MKPAIEFKNGAGCFPRVGEKPKKQACRACQDARLAKTVVVSAERKSALTAACTQDIVRIRAGTHGTI